jgi:ribonuclease P protein component
VNNFSFKKKFRLLSKKQYQDVFRNSYAAKFQEIVILGRKNNMKYPRLGISISKKNIKKSYQRNYFKRAIREFFRINKKKFFAMDFVIIVKKNFLFKKKFLKKLKILWFRNFFNKKKY